jgi:hypothetical protein
MISQPIGSFLSFKERTLKFDVFGKLEINPKFWNIAWGTNILGGTIFISLLLYLQNKIYSKSTIGYGLLNITVKFAKSLNKMPLELFILSIIVISLSSILQIIGGIIYKK